MTFTDRCKSAWHLNDSLLCVGLDPEADRLPDAFHGMPPLAAIESFCQEIVRSTAPFCAAFKPQVAHFSSIGAEPVLEQICRFIRENHPDHLLILDAKRADIGSTALHYAAEAFDRYQADAVTINPYLGTDSIEPFLRRPDKGIFVLCRTSNPGGDDLQMQTLASGKRLYEHVAQMAAQTWNRHGQVGLVVGATYPSEVRIVRQHAIDLPLLVPGIGVQGGDLPQTVHAAATPDGGLFLNSSRAILYASPKEDWLGAAVEVARQTHEAIVNARGQ
jgi:orotidine-5'-phosphate decarboxylase